MELVLCMFKYHILNSPGVQNMVASCTQDSKPLSVGNCSISILSFDCLKAVLMFNLTLALEMSLIFTFLDLLERFLDM